MKEPILANNARAAVASSHPCSPLHTLSSTPVHSHQDIPFVVFYHHSTPPKMKSAFAATLVALSAVMMSEVPGVHAVYNLVQSWEGQNFFDGWDFYGNYDNLTSVSPPWYDQGMALNPDAGRCDLGKPVCCHRRQPGIRGQQWKGHP